MTIYIKSLIVFEVGIRIGKETGKEILIVLIFLFYLYNFHKNNKNEEK